MTEHHDPEIAIDGGGIGLRAVVFSTNGEYLVSGSTEGVRLWRVGDGKEMARMTARNVDCAAVSNDGSNIAVGTLWGEVFAWNAETQKQVFEYREDRKGIFGVDFSPDSTRLVAALSGFNSTATVWDMATSHQVLRLPHDGEILGAKYSPQGDRIATVTVGDSVRVYGSNDGHLLVRIQVTVPIPYNNGLRWLNNHLLVISDNKIKQFDASSGSPVSEWLVPKTIAGACISLPGHGKFVAYSTGHTVTFWDIPTHTRLGLIPHPQIIWSVAVSPDDRFLAIGGRDGKIIIQSLSCINVPAPERAQQGEQPSTYERQPGSDLKDLSYLSSLPRIADSILLSPLHPALEEPDFHIDDAIPLLWKQDQLTNAEELLTVAITTSPNTTHPLFASRALVRAHLREWDTALVDAEMAIKSLPTVIGYIAKSIALVGKGEKNEAYRTCDIAFARSHSSHFTFLLLIKAIIVFMSGEHRDAISRIDDLIATVTSNSICYVVQAYMYLHLGNLQMKRSEYEGAIESFEHARAQMQHHTSQLLLMISLIFNWQFDNIGMMIRQHLCDAMYTAGRIKDAVECFNQMMRELGGEAALHGDCLEWAVDFRQRSSDKLVHLGDIAVDTEQHNEAISHYTTALSLNAPTSQGILIKRSKLFLATGSWKEALSDANQVIKLDPSSPWGYEMKHAALHRAGQYDDAVDAFETMLSKIAQSPDLDIQQRGDQYISSSTTRATIRKIVQRTTRHSPRVLINTSTGRLHNKAEQVSAFESLPIFKELVSSMTRRIDYVRIKREVREFFHYVMLSHKWEDNEPLFQHVIHIAVYDLDTSPTHDKLQTFCKIVRDGGFDWAWSDTCCIDRSDHFVLQEALVAMFKWYQRSALVIVFLRGVRSSSQLGALMKSIWNTRAWTLQEYVAAKIIHFYTEDWTPYLNLELSNHKESPEVMSEMEQATGVSAEQIMTLRPGLTNIREKLRLASTRQTTLIEDTAYSLLGIFSVTGLSAIYGEGEASLGRLLANVLTCSGDISILAWTGGSGNFNSCLPAQITVFDRPATSHFPSPIPGAEMERITTISSLELNIALSLYDRLSDLPAPWFAASRMKLPCIAFQLPSLSPHRTRLGRIYRVDTLAFGTVKIKTKYDLSRMHSLYLVHPWLETLLDREERGSGIVREDIAPPLLHMDDEDLLGGSEEVEDDEEIPDEEIDDSSSFSASEPWSHPAPSHTVPLDRETRARRLVARLRQPFGALLLALTSTGGRTVDYRRVAADSLITVRFQDNIPLADILDNVRTLDVL